MNHTPVYRSAPGYTGSVNKVTIPPLTMQDDKLGMSVWCFRSQEIYTFINALTILMGLQFWRDKCKKMQVGKRHTNYYTCKDSKVDAWEDVIKNYKLVDKYVGKEAKGNVEERTYLGQFKQNNVKKGN